MVRGKALKELGISKARPGDLYIVNDKQAKLIKDNPGLIKDGDIVATYHDK